MIRKIKAIWHEIIERWILLKLFPSRMERERMQLLAKLIERKDTLWKNIPVGKPRTLRGILFYRSWARKILSEIKKDQKLDEYKLHHENPVIHDALYEALKNIQQKEKENGEQ